MSPPRAVDPAEAIELVGSKRGGDGLQRLEAVYPGVMPVDLSEGEGQPSPRVTLRALKWFRRG